MSNNTDRNGGETPEVSEKAARRQFTAEYKARILAEADRCTGPGEIAETRMRMANEQPSPATL